MSAPLEILIGRVVMNARRVHDYTQLLFERDIVLNIYNEWTLSSGSDMRGLKGAKLIQAEEKCEALHFSFSNGKCLDVALCDEAYNGPEALELCVPGQPPVVWN